VGGKVGATTNKFLSFGGGFSGGWMGGWMPSVCVSARRQSILIKFHPLAEKQKRKEKENIIKMCSNFSLVFSTD